MLYRGRSVVVIMLTSAGRGLVRVAHGDPAPNSSQRDVDDVPEALSFELGTVGVEIRAREDDLCLALHGGIPVVLDGVIRAPGHHFGNLRPLVA